MSHRVFRLLSAACALALTTAACGDAFTGPSLEEFDADSAATEFEVVNGVLEGDLWDSFAVLGELFPIGAPAAGAAFAVQSAADVAATGDAHAAEHFTRDLALAMAAQVPKIPFEVRGITFVLDPETLQYVPSDLTGAPENGVRFILYAVNPVTKQPLPDTPIGHTDLIDLGDELANGVSLRVIVVSNEVTYFDYTVTATHTNDRSGSLDVAGFVSNGEHTVSFEIGMDAVRTETSKVMESAFVLEMDARNFRAAGTVRDEESEQGHSHRVALEIRIGDHLIALNASGNREEISGEVHVNGELFAVISGNPEHPTITGPGGRDLTEREVHTLRHIMELTERVFGMVEHLLKPAERILELDLFHRDRR